MTMPDPGSALTGAYKEDAEAFAVTSGNTAFASEALTIDSTAGGIAFTAATYAPTGGVPKRAKRAFVTAETAQMRYTYDGTAPTSTVGHILEAGQSITVEGYTNVSAFRAIRTGGTSGALYVSFER